MFYQRMFIPWTLEDQILSQSVPHRGHQLEPHRGLQLVPHRGLQPLTKTAYLRSSTSVIWGGFKLPDLADEVGLLVIELFVLGPVRVELGQKLNELVLIPY